jgi:ABC-type transporter Mla subunit MlaD
MAENSQTNSSSHTFLEEHQILARRIAELRQWWSELDALGVRKFGETAFRIEELRDLLAEHFAEEEQGGYLSAALASAPEFTGQAADLLQQHARFLDRLDKLIAVIRESESASDYWRTARNDLEQLLADLRRHEQSENALVQAAFQQDTGLGE